VDRSIGVLGLTDYTGIKMVGNWADFKVIPMAELHVPFRVKVRCNVLLPCAVLLQCNSPCTCLPACLSVPRH
jgi:hypothetical protein